MMNQYEFCGGCPDFGTDGCELRREELATNERVVAEQKPSKLKKLGAMLLFSLGSAYATPTASAYREYRNIMDAPSKPQTSVLPEGPSPMVEACIQRHDLKNAS